MSDESALDQASKSSERSLYLQNLRLTGKSLGYWIATSLFLLFCYALGFFVTDPVRANFTKFLSVFSNGALLAAAFSAIGFLFGFLFGIPRTQQDTAAKNKTADASSRDKQDPEYRQAVNTNLEQISDWLTKIIVGVGLTQLDKIPGKLVALAEFFKPGLDGSAIVAEVIVVNFLILGFFGGYLFTRLFLARAFWVADSGAAAVEAERQVRSETATTLESALGAINPDTPAEKKRQIYEELTYNFLYQDPPLGFQKAIEHGRAYLEKGGTPSARIWANLAFAYGQQYKYEMEHDKRRAVLDQARNDALNAVKDALGLEPSMKRLFRMVWDPTDVTKVSGEEDDLEVFYKDSEFKELLGG